MTLPARSGANTPRTRRRLPEAQAAELQGDLCRASETAQKAWFQDGNRSLDHEQAGTGAFPARFFLTCLAALELDGVALKEI